MNFKLSQLLQKLLTQAPAFLQPMCWNKLIYYIIGGAYLSPTLADCTFEITNYTNSTFSIAYGFYGTKAQESTIIKPAILTTKQISSSYQCNSVNNLGDGVAYIKFIKDQNNTSAIYSATNQAITLLGNSNGSPWGRELIADNKQHLWLSRDSTTVSDHFALKISFVQRPNSKSAGTN
jgi:hypothetical protein